MMKDTYFNKRKYYKAIEDYTNKGFKVYTVGDDNANEMS